MNTQPEVEMITFDVSGGVPVDLVHHVYAVMGHSFDPQGNGWLGQEELALVEIILQFPAAKDAEMRPGFRGGPVCFVQIKAPLSPDRVEEIIERIEQRIASSL